MARKMFTDESLATLVDETKAYVDDAVSTKADASHTHSEATQAEAGLLSAANKIQIDYGGIPIVTTSGTGAAYTATVDGMATLTVGMSFIMMPHTVSTSTAPTLNVNSLGAKAIRRMVSNSSTSTSAGYNAGWLGANKPVRVTYNGTFWIAELTKPSAADMSGTLGITNGGTGATTVDGALANLGITGTAVYTQSEEPTDAANGDIWVDLDGDTTSSVLLYAEQSLTDAQKAQARSNIGAASTPSFEVIKDVSAYTLTAADAGKMICFQMTSGTTTVTIPNDANMSMFPLGTEIEINKWNGGLTVNIVPDTNVNLRTTTVNTNSSISIGASYGVIRLKRTAAYHWLAMGDIA